MNKRLEDLVTSPSSGTVPPVMPDTATLRPSAARDLYGDLFGKTSPPRQGQSEIRPAAVVQPPRLPTTLAESGLTIGQLGEFILKQLYLQGVQPGHEIARALRLPFLIVSEGLEALQQQRCLEVLSGEVVSRATYRFQLTELGRLRAREMFDSCRYCGPAPVPLADYVTQCRRQAVTGFACTLAALEDGFRDLVVQTSLLEELGPALCSGRSIFLYGPPGNGKTLIAKGLGQYLHQHGGDIYVPYAVQTEGSIITVFDPVVHQTRDDGELARRTSGNTDATGLLLADGATDLRWRRIKRPVVITGGELTLDLLELQLNKVGNFYSAPLHIKANGGVFLIDDFGRQLVSPRELLNRWIVPLEERLDYLTLGTGRKIAIPFEQLTIFSTNLDPKDLVDDAFLRRIRHRIAIQAPDRATFTQIFERLSALRGLNVPAGLIEHLYATYYNPERPPRSSDPRDLLDLLTATCRFQGRPLQFDPSVFDTVCQRFFQRPANSVIGT